MPAKALDELGSLGGENQIWYKVPHTSGTWTDFGFLNKGWIVRDAPEVNEVDLAAGIVAQFDGKRPVGFEFEMTQTTKAAQDLVDTLNGKIGEGYVDNGVVGSKYQEIYYYKGKFFVTVELVEGAQPKLVKVRFIAEKQAANLSIADTALPSVKHAGVGTVAGNKYRVIFETAVT